MSDPYYDQTVLFLPFESWGQPGTQPVINDRSKYRSITPFEGTPQMSPTYALSGNYGCYLANNSSLKISDPRLAAGTSPFTYEGWHKVFAITGGGWVTLLVDAGGYSNNGWLVQVESGKVTLYCGLGTIGTNKWNIQATSVFSVGDVIHIAVTRDSSSVFRLFINGNLEASITKVGWALTAQNIWIGKAIANNGFIPAQCDDVRLTIGVCRYTANFTPTQIDLADYPVPAFSPKLVTHYRKSPFDYNSLPKYKAAITYYRKSPFDYNSLPKAKRYIRHEKNSIRDWSALTRVGRECVKNNRARNDFNNVTFGSLSISNQGTIAGIIKIYGSPVKRRVRLYESQSGAFVREMWSGEDGSYLFTGLRKEILYTITSTDYAEQYNDVIGTNILPT